MHDLCRERENDVNHDEKLDMVDAMKRFGGSFVKALAECFILADDLNLAKLEQAFPEYVKQYQEMAGAK